MRYFEPWDQLLLFVEVRVDGRIIYLAPYVSGEKPVKLFWHVPRWLR